MTTPRLSTDFSKASPLSGLSRTHSTLPSSCNAFEESPSSCLEFVGRPTENEVFLFCPGSGKFLKITFTRQQIFLIYSKIHLNYMHV